MNDDDSPEALGWVVSDLIIALTLVGTVTALVWGWL
jgi:hypothetical protein